MSIVEIIRRNDPGVTSVAIDFNDNLTDVEVTEALEQNPQIDFISFELVNHDTPALRSWPRLLRHLETRINLRRVSLFCDFIEWSNTSVAECQSILQVLQRNSNIRDFAFFFPSLCDEIFGPLVSFLDAALHITSVSLNGDEIAAIDGNNNNNGPALLSAALQRNANLHHLELRDIAPDYLVAIFDSLGTNRSLQSLNVCNSDLSAGALASFQKLMRNTSTIRELLVYRSGPGTRDTLLKIARGNFSLRTVGGHDTIFNDEDDTIFNDEDNRLLRFYSNRNERMDQWIERPVSVPKNLRPEVLHVAAQGHPSVLFRSLLAISGDLAPLKRTRKRKRPAYYKAA